ncbi:MAG TPA: hypothetical protein PL110_20325, partial [Candidatus Eremiobacteraeota bacterium]|nr:hypothetical protein [Candidatus Eremiobacteraeota bacterium]
QETMTLDVYEHDLADMLAVEKAEDPEGYFEFVIKKLEEDAFSYFDDVVEIINYHIDLMDSDRKIKLKNILASGIYMVASSSKDPKDKSYISDIEINMITRLVKALKLDELEYGKKLLQLKK